jgi:DDE family transposase
VTKDGRPFGSPPNPYSPPAAPEGKINTTDPDARRMKFGRNFMPAYNAQAVTTSEQIIVAAEITTKGGDFEQLEPMISAAERELACAGVDASPGVVLADSGYWSNEHIDSLRERGMTPIVAADSTRNRPRKNRLGGPYDFMRRVMATEAGGELYSKRQCMVEPVFAQIKANRRIERFKRRGRAAARSEWRLIAATHNLLKLHRHQLRPRPADRGGPRPVAVSDRAAFIARCLGSGAFARQPRVPGGASAAVRHEMPLRSRRFK